MSFSILQAGVAGIALALGAQDGSRPVTQPAGPVEAALVAGEPVQHLATPTGVDVPGVPLPASAIAPGVIEGLDEVLAREAVRVEPELNPKLRNGRSGVWELPSRRRSGFPHSGEHALTARWGDTRMGLGFNGSVDLDGVWVAGHATRQVWAPAVRAVGFAGGREVAATEWFEDVDATPSWFAIDLEGIDRVVFEARVAHAGAGFYSLDDLTFTRAGAEAPTVLDFEDLDYRVQLTGTDYGGLVWEAGAGDFTGTVQRPRTEDASSGTSGAPSATAGTGSSTEAATAPVSTLPNLQVEFAGPDQTDTGADWIPPDAHGAIGPNHFAAVVNQHLSIYDRTTTSRLSSVSLQSFFGGSTTVSKGDPRIFYDHFADRWLIVATDFGQGTSGVHFAWTTSNDPTASWFKTFIDLAQDEDAGTWPDYPTVGFDANGIYISAFMVGNGMSLFAIDKTPLLNLVPFIGTVTAWRSLVFEGALQPAVTFGSPSGAYVSSRFSFNQQRIRRVNPPLDAPTLTQVGFIGTKNGQPPLPAVALGSAVDLDTLDARHMNAVYRNGSLWVTHCVDKAGRSAINWYELDPVGLTVVQEGTVKSATDYYHYPSIAVNANSDVVIGFSASGPTLYAGGWYTGRLSTDPPGEMAAPAQYVTGGGPYNQLSNGANRWGDYSMTSVDPMDDLKLWTIQPHARSDGTWGTRVAQLQFGGCAPPTATPPLDAADCPGADVTFTTVASGTGPFTYQWRKDGFDLPGETGSSYVASSITSEDAGVYTCAVSDVCGTVLTGPGVLTVYEIVDSTPPQSGLVCDGGDYTFDTVATGNGPFTYQWRKDGIDISGATASAYTVTGASALDAGTYDVIVTGLCGPFTSAPATLAIDNTVSATDPVGGTFCEGTSAGFNTVPTGGGPFTYQWRKDGIDIPGATSNTFTLVGLTLADAGDYDVVVTGDCDSTTTLAATLVVDAAVTATDPVGATVCEGTPVSFDTTAGGTGPLSYQWKLDGSAIPGATAPTYDLAAAGPADAGSYTVEVTGACGVLETAAATLVVDPATVASDPAPQLVCDGDPASFDTVASGSGALTYQWKKDGADIPGATSSSLSIPAASAADEGDYSVVVTGACGSLETATAPLALQVPTSATDPAATTACEGTAASFSTLAGGSSPFSFQWKKDGAPILGATASTYSIATVSAGDAGAYSVEVTGACGMVETAAASLTVDAATTATDPLDQTACTGGSASFDTTASGTGALTYQWKKDGLDIPGATAASYDIPVLASGDAGAYSVEVTGACGSIETAAALLTVDDAPTATDPVSTSGCAGTTVAFDTQASGVGPFTYQWKKDGLDIGGATAASYSIAALASGDAGAYSVEVTGACGSIETAAATLTVDDPVTATDPLPAEVCPGASITFDTVASGTGPFSYQWKKDTVAIPGATSSAYTIAVVAGTDAGNYSVEVTGACGAYETASAQLKLGVTMVNYCTAGTSASGCQATLVGTGTPSATAPSGFVVIATGAEGDKDGLFFFGKNGRQANPWGNSSSFQCIVPPVRRGGLLSGVGTAGQCDGLFGQDLNARWQAKPNHNPGAGATVQVQLWYRDPQSTSNQSTAFSDALEVPVCP